MMTPGAPLGAAHRRNNSGFNPSIYGTVKLWFDAGATTGLSNNDPVTTWTDLSGLGFGAFTDSTGYRPTFKTAQVNGRAAIDFNGGKYLRTTYIPQNSITAFAVARRTNTSNSITTPISIGQYNLTNASIDIFTHSVYNTPTGSVKTYFDSPGASGAYYKNGAASPLTISDAEWAVVSASATGFDFSAETSAKYGVRLNSVLDSYGAYSYFLGNEDIAEVVVFLESFSAGQHATVAAMLMAKYGIT